MHVLEIRLIALSSHMVWWILGKFCKEKTPSIESIFGTTMGFLVNDHKNHIFL